MPYAVNPFDGVRTYFEDDGGSGPPVVFYAGLTEPLDVCRESGLARALEGRCRLIFADHRDQGKSDKPHDPEAYALRTRVADAVAVLHQLGIEKAHFIGFSWGARLGFAIGEHAPQRAASLVLCGNQPYAWDTSRPLVRTFSEALAGADDTEAFVAQFEELLDFQYPEPIRSRLLEMDLEAIRASWQCAMAEGPVSKDLTKWRVPCLIYAGELDDMHDNARRAAGEIPGAKFISLAGQTHASAESEVDAVLPDVLRLLEV